MKLWMNVSEAARETGISPTAIRKMVNRGAIKKSKDGLVMPSSVRKAAAADGVGQRDGDRIPTKEASRIGAMGGRAAARAKARKQSATSSSHENRGAENASPPTERNDGALQDTETAAPTLADLDALSEGKALAKFGNDSVAYFVKLGRLVDRNEAQTAMQYLLRDVAERIRSLPVSGRSILLEAGLSETKTEKALADLAEVLLGEIDPNEIKKSFDQELAKSATQRAEK